MYKFSEKSLKLIAECHPDLQRLLHEVIKVMDISILIAYRNEKDQNDAYNKGASKLKYPESKHNKIPSLAVDIAPYPIDFKDLSSFYFLAGIISAKAEQLGIKVRWGGCWRCDNKFKENDFQDLVHFELS